MRMENIKKQKLEQDVRETYGIAVAQVTKLSGPGLWCFWTALPPAFPVFAEYLWVRQVIVI